MPHDNGKLVGRKEQVKTKPDAKQFGIRALRKKLVSDMIDSKGDRRLWKETKKTNATRRGI